MVSKDKRETEKDTQKQSQHCLVLRVQTFKKKKRSGDDSKEDPPVPMPNTEVKLLNVDGTWWATARESRKLPELKYE